MNPGPVNQRRPGQRRAIEKCLVETKVIFRSFVTGLFAAVEIGRAGDEFRKTKIAFELERADPVLIRVRALVRIRVDEMVAARI